MSHAFADRHIGLDTDARQLMLDALGYPDLASMMDAAVPAAIRQSSPLRTLPEPASEAEALAELRAIADHNTVRRSLIGQGYYGTFTPAVIQRNVFREPELVHRLHAVPSRRSRRGASKGAAELPDDGPPTSPGCTRPTPRCSDEATAVVEGMLLARRASKSTSNLFLRRQRPLSPRRRAVLDGRAEALGLDLAYLPLAETDPADLPESFGVFRAVPGRIPVASGTPQRSSPG